MNSRLARHRWPAAAAVAVSMVTGALTAPAVANAREPVPTTTSSTVTGLPVGGVQGVLVPAVRWEDDGDGYQRASIPVPKDYRDPRGATIALNVVKLPAAKPQQRIGSLFVNFGGPGLGAADRIRSGGKNLFPPAVLDRYDLIGVDAPGTGKSQPVRCADKISELIARSFIYYDFPETAAEHRQATGQAADYAAECRRRNGDLLDHIGTLRVARDLDVLRAAFGDTTINLYGLSYGTLLGQVVANVFPDRTGALVLDGVVDPAWISGSESTVSWIRTASDVGNFETLFEFFRRCDEVGKARCAFAGDSDRAFARLAAKLSREPLPVTVAGQKVPFDYSVLVTITQGWLNEPTRWPILGQLLEALDRSDSAAVAKALTPPANTEKPQDPPTEMPYDNYPDANAAVTCADTDNPSDPRRYRSTAQRRDAGTAPYFGSRWTYLGLPCHTWQGRSVERYTGPWNARTANPVLVIGTRFDPATPYRSAEKATQVLPNSTLVTLDGVGHTSFGRSACVTAAVTTYLTTLSTPAHNRRVCAPDSGPFDKAAAANKAPAATPEGAAVSTGDRTPHPRTLAHHH